MKILAIALIVMTVLFGIFLNVRTLLTCDGAVVQGAFKYECIE